MKFARPLYRLLRASSKARQLAIDTFELHQVGVGVVGEDKRRLLNYSPWTKSGQ
jgi:hypothetical protein